MRGILALAMILFCASAGAAQQPAGKRSTPKQAKKTASPLLVEAETFVGEGRVNDAKSKIQEELRQNPANAEAYELLGAISVSEKDSTLSSMPSSWNPAPLARETTSAMFMPRREN